MPQAATRIRKAAERSRKERLTALLHHITPEVLGAAYFALKKDAAAGIDGVTWDMYGEGAGRAIARPSPPPSRRRSVPGAACPAGGDTQAGRGGHDRSGSLRWRTRSSRKAVVDVILTPIYEAEFLGFSYGFRPGRGAHDALDALAFGIERRKVSWIVDADLEGILRLRSRGIG